MKRGFDAGKYIAAQGNEIAKRVARFNRLYLEVGGKLCYDKHAARVLPGYKESSKVEILNGLSVKLGIVYCVNARDLISERDVGMSGLDYEDKVLKDLKDIGSFFPKSETAKVVIARFSGEGEAKAFGVKLRRLGYEVYFHGEIKGYGDDLDATFRGYGRNDYVEVGSDLVVVTGPASGSGKMRFALSQIYHERKRNVDTGFAKFESFPIWNLPLGHPVNLAYEAATADLGDFNVVDVYHKKAYGKRAVNYNRDVDNFGILIGIAQKISGKRWPCGYRSPTDMGVNMMKVGIVDDLVCRRAGELEILKRLRVAEKIDKGSLEVFRLRKILGKLR